MTWTPEDWLILICAVGFWVSLIIVILKGFE